MLMKVVPDLDHLGRGPADRRVNVRELCGRRRGDDHQARREEEGSCHGSIGW
jgi:hypothetical protein